MSGEEITSDERVKHWEAMIVQQVMEINRIKLEIPQPEQRNPLIERYVNSSLMYFELLARVKGQLYALEVIVKAYHKMINA